MRNLLTAILALGTVFAYNGTAAASCWADITCRMGLINDFASSSYSSNNLPSGGLIYGGTGADHANDSAMAYRIGSDPTFHTGSVEVSVDFDNNQAKIEAYRKSGEKFLTSEFSDLRFDASKGRIDGALKYGDEPVNLSAMLRNSGDKGIVLGKTYGNVRSYWFAKETGSFDSVAASSDKMNLPTGTHYYIGDMTDNLYGSEYNDKTLNVATARVDFTNYEIDDFYGYNINYGGNWYYTYFHGKKIPIDMEKGTFNGPARGSSTFASGLAPDSVIINGKFSPNGTYMTGTVKNIESENVKGKPVFDVKFGVDQLYQIN